MKTTKKILSVILALCLALAFTACEDEPIEEENDLAKEELAQELTAYGDFEDYYAELAYSVNDENGNPTEVVFVLCTDEELTDAVGKKSVSLNADGTVSQYTVTIGVMSVERMVTYRTMDSSTFYSDIAFDENSLPLSSSWDNTLVNAETGEATRKVGSETYENGIKVSSVEEVYSGETLVSKTTREYSETGEIIKETVE